MSPGRRERKPTKVLENAVPVPDLEEQKHSRKFPRMMSTSIIHSDSLVLLLHYYYLPSYQISPENDGLR
jgi:hypothetical protein